MRGASIHRVDRDVIGAFHLHQNSDKSHFCLSSTFMLKKDRSEIYLSFDVNGKHLLSCDTHPISLSPSRECARREITTFTLGRFTIDKRLRYARKVLRTHVAIPRNENFARHDKTDK